jgi:hypothetical protein
MVEWQSTSDILLEGGGSVGKLDRNSVILKSAQARQSFKRLLSTDAKGWNGVFCFEYFFRSEEEFYSAWSSVPRRFEIHPAQRLGFGSKVAPSGNYRRYFSMQDEYEVTEHCHRYEDDRGDISEFAWSQTDDEENQFALIQRNQGGHDHDW